MNHAEAYKTLGLAYGENDAAKIRDAYRAAAKVAHPDAGGTAAKFQAVKAAYDFLRANPAAPAAGSAKASTAGQAKAKASTAAPKVAASREDWMIEAYRLMGIHLAAVGMSLPEMRFSVGYGRGGRRKLWAVVLPRETADGKPQAFISPETSVAGRVVEMMAEAAASRFGVGSDQAKIVVEVLKLARAAILAEVGGYPHAEVTGKAVKTQTTRLIKAGCGRCGYTIRLSQKWADVGLPECPCCGKAFKIL